MDSSDMKNQAQYIWNRLDDLANTDMDAYKKFIEKQMEEQKIIISAPEPKQCIQTRTLADGKSKEKDVYINIFGWKRITYPATDDEPIKLMAGQETSPKNGSGKPELVLPVVMNDKMFDECTEKEIDKNQLFSLILAFVEEHCKVKLSRNHKKYSQVYRGDLPKDTRTLFVNKSQIPGDVTSAQASSTVNTPADVLKHLSSEGGSEKMDAGGVDAKKAMDALLGKREMKKKLIQEIKDEAPSEEWKKLPRPEHTFNKLAMDGRHPERCILKIHLPSVSGVSECDLTLTELGAELIVKDKFFFSMDFPTPVNEDTAAARFNKKSSCLTVMLPLK